MSGFAVQQTFACPLLCGDKSPLLALCSLWGIDHIGDAQTAKSGVFAMKLLLVLSR